jgi:hypothetical protein
VALAAVEEVTAVVVGVMIGLFRMGPRDASAPSLRGASDTSPLPMP